MLGSTTNRKKMKVDLRIGHKLLLAFLSTVGCIHICFLEEHKCPIKGDNLILSTSSDQGSLRISRSPEELEMLCWASKESLFLSGCFHFSQRSLSLSDLQSDPNLALDLLHAG